MIDVFNNGRQHWVVYKFKQEFMYKKSSCAIYDIEQMKGDREK